MSAVETDLQMEELRGLFLARLRAERAEIDIARAAGETESALPTLHRIAGSAGIFGFPDISRAAATCEDAIRSGAEPALDALLQLLDRHLAAA